MGFVEPFWDSKPSIQAMAATLNAHASGGLYLQQQFTLLVYPTGTADWAFLDPEVKASPKLGLKVIMRGPVLQPFEDLLDGPLQDQLPVNPAPLPDEPRITTVFRHLANIDYKTLIHQNARKNKDPNTFFLMFPPSSKDEHELVVKFLEANKATIYSSYTPGSWDYFTSHVDAGVILVSIVPLSMSPLARPADNSLR
jgi:chromo domain-containing protein 1